MKRAQVGDDPRRLGAQELRELAPALPPGKFRALLEPASWLESKVSEGGTSLPRVREQLAQARHVLEDAPA